MAKKLWKELFSENRLLEGADATHNGGAIDRVLMAIRASAAETSRGLKKLRNVASGKRPGGGRGGGGGRWLADAGIIGELRYDQIIGAALDYFVKASQGIPASVGLPAGYVPNQSTNEGKALAYLLARDRQINAALAQAFAAVRGENVLGFLSMNGGKPPWRQGSLNLAIYELQARGGLNYQILGSLGATGFTIPPPGYGLTY